MLVLGALGALAGPARAEPVLVLDGPGRTHVEQQPLGAGAATGPWPSGDAPGDATALASRRRTVAGELRRMLRAGAITQAEHDERRAAYDSARKLVRKLSGARRVELGASVRLLDTLAAQGSLTVSRLRPLWLTLARNRQWWTTGPLLGSGRRVSFHGSEVVWQYFPGQGLQIHPLANFGKLNGLWEGRIYDDRLATLLDELLPLAAERGGGLAWEYYFRFAGGRPPWVSGMAQATALQSLARAGIRLQRKDEVFAVTDRAERLFELAPPTGVRVRAGGGAHYLLYSFDRRLRVLNGFVQALNGLYDYGAYANDDAVRALFADGERELRRELPRYDTGAWSLYSRGRVKRESDLSYHKLVRGFLGGLCERTAEDRYCDAEQRFSRYLGERPKLEVLSKRARGGRSTAVRFNLSKISRVSVRVAGRGRVVLARAGVLMGYGTRAVGYRAPRRPGDYTVSVTAVDLAGNVGTTTAMIRVTKPPKRKSRR